MVSHRDWPPCPHPGDRSHAGLGKPWCDAGREGVAYRAARDARVADYLARTATKRTAT